MTKMTSQDLQGELTRHVGFDGAVPARVVELVARDGAWEGRLWEVLRIVAEDRDRMAFLCGGLHPAEVATWVGFWAEADLEVDQVAAIVAAGGYDPEPFEVLARHGLLDRALRDGAGMARRIDGELAGTWISDRFATTAPDEILAWAEQFPEQAG
ncbi:MAG: hypothetical protein M0013_00135 [Actinomycetota bacterium]|nr:hypothetical protein [Actinomycetota bacterium]